MKNKKSMKIIILISLILVVLASIGLFSKQKEQLTTAKLDAATLRALQYEQLEDDEMFVDNCKYVKFGAFFTKNLDDDEEAERVLGSCNEIGSSDTLYMDLNILSNGHLKDGKITINSTNFTLKMQMVKDSVLKNNYISNNVKEIELNTVNSGTQKLIMGTIHASISDKDSYTKVNTITLTGTHVADDGTETKIEKTIDLTVDWYGTASASLKGASTEYEPTDFSTEKDLSVQFCFSMQETTRSLIPAKNIVQATIPTLLDYEPIEVSCNISSSNYNYDEENRILYIENESTTRENNYIVTVTYPKEAVEGLIAQFNEQNLFRITSDVTGYYECYNNGNEQFVNPYITNTASGIASVTVKVEGSVKASHLVDVSISDKSYITYPFKGYGLSKETLLEAYDSEEIENITYKVNWSVYRYKKDVDRTTLVIKDSFDEGDLFDNNYIEQYVSNVGVYFGETALIPDDGSIFVYNDETNELVKEFKNGEWKKYTIATPFYYDEGIKDIRVETTEDKQSVAHFIVSNIRELDIQKLKKDYTRAQVEDISKLKTHMTISGSNIANDFTEDDQVNLILAKSYNEISVSPNYIATSETDPIDSTITIRVPAQSMSYAAWQNGTFLVEIPSKIIYMNLEDVSIDNDKVAIDGYELYKENNKYFIKIVTSNDQIGSGFAITLKTKMLADPMSGTIYENIKLYSHNEYCDMYYDSTYDTYDINGNEDKSETIRVTTTGLLITAPSSFVTVETVSNYNDAGEITVAPNIAEVTRGTREATINVDFANNYEDTVSNIELLGKIPYKGNTYVNGDSLNSEFTAKITGNGITIPDELKNFTKVYYSEKDDPTKDVNNVSNGWILAENVTSFENIKTYLIVIDNYELVRSKKYSFSYNVAIPQDVTFNCASYACHTVYFKINTAGGMLESSVQPNKVGIRIVRYYDFEIMKYKEGTTLGVPDAKYSISEENEEKEEVNTRILTSTPEGKLYLSDLKVNQVYIFKEIQAPKSYELNTEVIKFKVTENSNQELEFVLVSDESFEGEITFEKDLNGKDVMKSSVVDLPKISLNITKIDKDSKNPISGVMFELNGKTYITNSNGKIKIENLSLDEQYSLKETSANGYYFSEDPITFSISRNNNNELVVISNNELFSNANITNDDTTPLIQVDATIVNEKIPTYNLHLVKIDENNEELKLEGARFLLEREDFGNSIYYTTNQDGCIDISNLYQYVEGKSITGKYTLQEVESPNGYINNKEKITFVVTKNSEGKLQMNIENEENLETVRKVDVNGENITLTIQDKAMFKITKIDSETKAPLANAEFIIYELKEDGTILDFAKDVNGEYIGTKNSDGKYVVVSDKQGTITAAIGNGSYKLIESKAPNGYEENLKAEIFTITGNKEIESEDTAIYEPTEKEVLEINSIEDLVEFSNSVNEGNSYKNTIVKLKRTLDFNEDDSYEDVANKAALIDKNGSGFTPIGSNYSSSFSGEFDGQGFEISNIYIYANQQYGGLFGYVDGATIRNLGITGNITVNTSGYACAAGIVGYATDDVYIINCYNKANVSAKGTQASASGIASNGKISYCYNTGNIEAVAAKSNSSAYGIGLGKSVFNCYNRGNITSTAVTLSYAYGIGGNARNCYNTGNIISESTEDTSNAGAINNKSENNNYYSIDTAEITAVTIYENNTKVTSSHMKTEEFVNQLDTEYWSMDTQNINDGYPVLKDMKNYSKTIEISKIEELVSLSKDVLNGNDYRDVTIILKETLNFDDENSYNKPNDNQGFGDINGDGEDTGIKDELTNKAGKGFLPIGDYYNTFSGTFDGNGNEIQNLYINRAEFGIGLFGVIRKGKVINLGVTGEIKGSGQVGGICGFVQGFAYLENCYNKCEISCTDSSYSIGGIIGQCSVDEDLKIISCKNYGSVSGYEQLGGIIGLISNSSENILVSNCSNYGYISGINEYGNYFSGIIGRMYNSKNVVIENCSNDADISANEYAGGILGDSEVGNLKIYNSKNTGNINTSDRDVGGIAGNIDGGTVIISSCYNTGNIVFNGSSNTRLGGIIGNCDVFDSNMIIENSYNSGNININSESRYSSNIGGIAGYTYGNVGIKSCYNTGRITSSAPAYMGGIVGTSYVISSSAEKTVIDDCYNIGDLSMNPPENITNSNYNIGGIAGIVDSSIIISNCYNTANITVDTWLYGELGGISGHGGTLTYVYNTGNITLNSYGGSTQYIAGISGYSTNITHCYNNGDIIFNGKSNSTIFIGGICGSGTKAEYCYNNGNITSNINSDSSVYEYVGGIIGSGDTVTFSYNTGKIKNTVNSTSASTVYVGGILASGTSVANCYNQGEIDNFVVPAYSTYQTSVYAGGIIGTGTSVACTYNTGALYNNVEDLHKEPYIYTGIIAGRLTGSTGSSGNNYYPSKIEIVGENINNNNQTEVTDEYMKTEEFYNKLALGQTTWKYMKDEYPILDIPVLTKTEKNITEIIVENIKENYEITVEIMPDENGEYIGGTTSGNYTDKYLSMYYKKLVETVTYGEKSKEKIEITPKTGYQIAKITINDKDYVFETNEEGVAVIPAGYFLNVDKNYNVAVTFSLKENTLTINKVDEQGNPLEGAVFDIHQVETRPAISDEVKDLIKDSPEASYANTGISNNELLGELTKNGTYYFEKQNNGTYSSNNKGIANSSAQSYLKIDLSNATKNYYVVVNATVSSQYGDFAIGVISQNTNTIDNNTVSGRFMQKAGNLNAANYTSGKLTAGNVYYLHLAYIKNSGTDSFNDTFTINNINLYEEQTTKMNFEEVDGKYKSAYTEPISVGTYATAYIPIDLSKTTGKYTLTVNAEISGNTSQRGYVVITDSTDRVYYSTNALVNISGTIAARNYITVLEAGKIYYVHLSHQNSASTITGVNNVFTINSINLSLNTSDFYHETGFVTNSKGQITKGLKYGTYSIVEKQAPEGYTLNSEPTIHEIGDGTNNNIKIENKSKKSVTAHYYLNGTGKQFGNDPKIIINDVVQYGNKGDEYTTTPYITLEGYTLIKENDEYVIPKEASGFIGDENIDVYYYYEEITYGYTVNYYYDGILDSNETITGKAKPGEIISTYEDKEKEGYGLDKTENLPLTISTFEDENIINIYYTTILAITTDVIEHDENYTDGTVIENQKGGTISGEDQKPYEQIEIGSSNKSEIKIDPNDGYQIVKILINEEPFDFSSKLTEDGNIIFEPGYFNKMQESKHIKVEFRKSSNVIVKYLEKDTEKVLYKTEDGKEYEEIIGYESQDFKTERKTIEGYIPATPEITNDKKVEIKPDGKIYADTLTIIYWYQAEEATIIERFFEVFENGEVSEMAKQVNIGKSGENLTSNRRIYELYDSANGPSSTDNNIYVADKDEDSKTITYNASTTKEIWYYYIKKKSNITVIYRDNITGEEIGTPEIKTDYVGLPYNIKRKEIPGYRLDENRLPNNETGFFTLEGDTVTYYYIELKEYELEVVYTVDSKPINDVKIAVENEKGLVIDDYLTNGKLSVEKVESTDIGTSEYKVYESQTPEVYKQILTKEKPGQIKVVRTFDESERRYKVTAECNDIEELDVVVDDVNNKITIYIETVSKYNLSIKKFISAIDNTIIENRAPVVTVNSNGKPEYTMNQDIEKVSNSQNVTYTLRMFNESNITAKGKRIIEYIPDGLVFLPENEKNISYGWKLFGVTEDAKLYETNNVDEAKLVVTDYLVNKEIEAFNGEELPHYLDVEVVFEVDETKLTSKDRIIENKVRIMPNDNDDYPDNDQSSEKLYVKYFDLTIEKYIDKVIIENKKGSITQKYGNNQNGNPIKIDIKKSEVNDTVITVTYGLLIKNVGEIPGYATEIVDYTPENFILVEDGKWIIDGKVAKSTLLSGILLNPGESTVAEVTYKWNLSENNIGTRINEAEITKYTNNYGAIDLTDDNKDDEKMIVTIKTGLEEILNFIIPFMGAAIIVAVGIILIKKKIDY